MPPHPLLILFYNGLSIKADLTSDLHDREGSEGVCTLHPQGLHRGVSPAVGMQHSCSHRLSWEPFHAWSPPPVPHKGCAAMKTCALSWTHFSFTCFPSLADYIFKGHAGTEWNTSILPVAAPGCCWKCVISLWERQGEGWAGGGLKISLLEAQLLGRENAGRREEKEHSSIAKCNSPAETVTPCSAFICWLISLVPPWCDI